MGLFSSSKSKQETNVTDARVGASEGSIVAQDSARISFQSLDPKTIAGGFDLARFAISEATRGAAQTAAGVLQATASQRAADQQLLAAAITPDAAAGGELLRTILIFAAIAAGAFVLARRA